MRVVAPAEPVTLEQLMNLITAMLAHGWGTLEVTISDHTLHAVHPRLALRTGSEVDHLTLALTQGK